MRKINFVFTFRVFSEKITSNRHLRDLVANVADPLGLFVARRASVSDPTLPAHAVPATRAPRAGVVKSTERRAASRAFASLMG